jgi:hypothetical protein
VAFTSTAAGLWTELKRSIEARDQFLGEPYWESVRRYCGPMYRNDSDTAVDFENHSANWKSIFLPILASGNPRVRGHTPRLGGAVAFAKAVELAVNRNFELTDVKRTIEQLATDWADKWSVALTTPTPQPGMREREDPPFRPTTKRLSLEDYTWDHLTKQHAEARFQAHRVVRDKEDVLEEAANFPQRGWNEAIVDAMGTDKARQRQRQRLSTSSQRGEVEYWEVWVPEINLETALDINGEEFQPTADTGYNGTIFTICPEASEHLREPRPFWGPRDGPYTYSGYLYVPDEVVPLSPLVMTAAQAEIYNSVMSSAIQNIRGYKRGIAVGSDAGKLADVLEEFQDSGILTVESIGKLQEQLQQIELLGLTPQHQLQITMLRDLLERSSGISEALQGQTSGATATEASIASMSVGKRMGYMTEKFIGGMVKPIAKKEAWYLAMDPRSRTSLGALAEGMFMDPKTGQPIEMPVLVGGPEHGDLLEDFDVEIQPISMRFTTEMLEAERAASWEQFVLSTAPMIPTTPYIDWSLMFSRKAEQLGDPSLARVVDVEKALMMGKLQMMMTMGVLGAQAPLQSQQTSSQPRLGIDMPKPQAPPAPQLKASERPGGFSSNARKTAATSGQKNKAPRTAGASSSTR